MSARCYGGMGERVSEPALCMRGNLAGTYESSLKKLCNTLTGFVSHLERPASGAMTARGMLCQVGCERVVFDHTELKGMDLRHDEDEERW